MGSESGVSKKLVKRALSGELDEAADLLGQINSRFQE
jgi:hypothetical protein